MNRHTDRHRRILLVAAPLLAKVEVVVLTPPGTSVDCTRPTTAEFDGKITATGPGRVRSHWTFGAGSGPVSPARRSDRA
ncbi:hypothetical protein [Streptomyces yangpuensis]|uniref:hypothetical protein n=1 Tax=Streptomyces yangpuensis TaxID=1648182 RepID=UPI0037246104